MLKGENCPTIRTIGFRDPEAEDQFCVVGLDVDIRGYGETYEQAEKEFLSLLKAQIDFAIEKNKPELVFFQAEQKYFDLYNQALAEKIHFEAMRRKAVVGRFAGIYASTFKKDKTNYEVSSVAIPYICA